MKPINAVGRIISEYIQLREDLSGDQIYQLHEKINLLCVLENIDDQHYNGLTKPDHFSS